MNTSAFDASGIPPVISTTGKSDGSVLDTPPGSPRESASIDPASFDKSSGLTPTEKDESTAGETCLDSSTGFSSCNHTQTDSPGVSAADEDEDSADDVSSDDDDTASIRSQQTYDSTRLLLKQAQQRMEQQSIYEEVKLLRAEVAKYRTSEESALRQTLDLTNRNTILQNQLAQAMDTIQTYKKKESRGNEERAEREKDFMNQLNDVCRTTEQREQDLMDEIVKRDVKIIELQNQCNEEEIRRRSMRPAMEAAKKGTIAAYVETQARTVTCDEEVSWSDESSCEFI